ncbi:DUF4276 family protein [uncultured Treponema sp.]|uniref:DUF4276 family protein n=1 Tax=uncultured Treponema sp. TaxID=162155 RepID=UPI00258AE632|nr:DUF4276 family protein [uncultured Treponema sp.]
MVTIRIIVEGGSAENKNIDTANNTESLRQSLNLFFSRLLNRTDISIIMGYGYRNAAKNFLKNYLNTNLFVDSDCPSNKLSEFFTRLEKENAEPIFIPDDRKKYVFFMIQEMEAWFLKQPQCFDLWAKKEGYSRRTNESICQHSLIRSKNIEDIEKPSIITKTLLKHFFEKKVVNKKRKLAVYGKLKTAPILLDCIDVESLEKQDSELRRFKKQILRKI